MQPHPGPRPGVTESLMTCSRSSTWRSRSRALGMRPRPISFSSPVSGPVPGEISSSPSGSSLPVVPKPRCSWKPCTRWRVRSSTHGKRRETLSDAFSMVDLRSILTERVGLPDREIPDDEQTSFDSIGLDSLAFLEVQLEVEARYGFQVSDEDAQAIKTFGDAIAYMNRRLQEA
ncbi:MAG: acyl carrier protein [Actinobacteria bacterium]|nr:MAG: acyl carrier protein [Actinomycetota bacterium]